MNYAGTLGQVCLTLRGPLGSCGSESIARKLPYFGLSDRVTLSIAPLKPAGQAGVSRRVSGVHPAGSWKCMGSISPTLAPELFSFSLSVL